MTLIIKGECISPVKCQQGKKQDHKEPVKESCGIVVETPLATASGQKLALPDVCLLKEKFVCRAPGVSHH